MQNKSSRVKKVPFFTQDNGTYNVFVSTCRFFKRKLKQERNGFDFFINLIAVIFLYLLQKPKANSNFFTIAQSVENWFKFRHILPYLEIRVIRLQAINQPHHNVPKVVFLSSLKLPNNENVDIINWLLIYVIETFFKKVFASSNFRQVDKKQG